MDNGESSYRRFLDGDNNAFGEVVDIYKDSLIFFINRYVHNFAVAEELAQDVFVELLLHKRRYNFKTSLKTYIFTIGRNLAVSYIRKCARRPECAYEYIENEQDVAMLEDEFIKKEQARELHEALGSIAEDYSTALHLIYFEGMSYEQVGKVMKKNKKQVENIVYRAKKALRKELEKEVSLYENK
ncbi:MAG: sigma-70 family RNA polymerase sigma factor [Clostridia bacterium]|nr:sigma-70 family RNA polymerase sigma factor [Clostridia bacterium]